MNRDDTEVVREILEDAFGDRSEAAIEAISESVVIQPSTSHVFVGHEGFREWLRHARAGYAERRFEERELTGLGGGFVLLAGTSYGRDHRGELEAIPGAWLINVRGGRMNSLIYFRTPAGALAAVSADTPQARRQVVDQVVEAFNRNDFTSILASVSADYRFSIPMFEGVDFEGHFDAADVLEAVRERYDAYLIDSHRITELGGGWVALDTRDRAVRNGHARRFAGTWLIRIEGGLFRETSYHAHLDEAIAAFEARAGRGEWLTATPHTLPPSPDAPAAGDRA